jgi:endonuclease YncB( thermonuclease family)
MFRFRFVPAAALIALALLIVQMVNRVPDDVLTGMGRAKDGDSLVVNGRELRLKGMDAPEFQQHCTLGGQQTPCGRQAATALRRWLERGPVTCIGNEVDRYGRLLVTCRIKGADIGADLVRNGFAVDFGSYPDEEREASKAYRGIWAGSFERPQTYRARMREQRSNRSTSGFNA